MRPSRRSVLAGTVSTLVASTVAASHEALLKPSANPDQAANLRLVSQAPARDSDAVWHLLESELDDAVLACQTALQRHQAARVCFHAAMPPLPPELLLSPSEVRSGMTGEHLRDMDDKIVWSPIGRPKVVATVHYLDHVAPNHYRFAAFSKAVAKKRPIAEKYERATHEAREQSGLTDAENAFYFASRRLESVAGRIMETPSDALPAFFLKTRAVAAYARCGRDEAIRAGTLWGVQLAEEAGGLRSKTIVDVTSTKCKTYVIDGG